MWSPGTSRTSTAVPAPPPPPARSARSARAGRRRRRCRARTGRRRRWAAAATGQASARTPGPGGPPRNSAHGAAAEPLLVGARSRSSTPACRTAAATRHPRGRARRPGRQQRAAGGPGGQVPAGGVADDRDVGQVEPGRPPPAPGSASSAAATSSAVRGQPPPAPTRRYSTATAANPAAARSAASGRASSMPYAARQKPPCRTTTTGAGAAAGREGELEELVGVRPVGHRRVTPGLRRAACGAAALRLLAGGLLRRDLGRGLRRQGERQLLAHRHRLGAPDDDDPAEDLLQRRGRLGALRGRAADHPAEEPPGAVDAEEAGGPAHRRGRRLPGRRRRRHPHVTRRARGRRGPRPPSGEPPCPEALRARSARTSSQIPVARGAANAETWSSESP